MLFNYIKIALRSLLKNKGYSFLNIFGLAIGITCASLIFLWVEDELSFNSNFENQDQVYYVPTNQEYGGKWRTIFATPGPLAIAMKNDIPGIKYATRSSNQERLFNVGDNAVNLRGRYTDEDFLDIFNLNFIKGNRKTAFSNPHGIILTQETANTLFGNNVIALNKTIKMNNKDIYVVTGIIEDLPKNTTFSFNWIAPFERYSNGQEWMTEYANNFSDTFVELELTANFETVDTKVRNFINAKDKDITNKAFLYSVKDWHLRSKFEDGKIVGGRITYVRLFTIIAFIILLIACINFMNLSTARSEKRANEVGVRKAMGSTRGSLIIQFISEALVLSFMATVLSVLFLLVLLPEFNLIIDKDLSLGLENPLHLTILVSISVICGLFAGLYPAFYLSSFKPIAVLKGLKVSEGSASFIRKGLVVGQFTISIVFIIVTILVYQQIQFAKNRDLGYDKDQLLSMRINSEVIDKFDVIQQDLINSNVADNITLCNSELLSAGFNGSGFNWKGGGAEAEDVLISYRYVTQSFFETTGMEIIAGSGFSNSVDADSTSTMVTESLAKMMGSDAKSAIGKRITRGENTNLEIIGVVKDYLYGNVYGSSDPVLFFNYPQFTDYMYIKTKVDIPVDDVLSNIKSVFKKHVSSFPFDYTFVDEAFNAKFINEQLVGELSKIFAILAILISCLGLFGLAAYTAEKRSKEIGIRKVLGASVSGLVKLLSKDFLKLVGLSILIAIPIAWYAMDNWLQDYAYRIEINWWIFAIAGVVAILIAMLTVSFQAVKAAIANPVNSLRAE